MAARQSVCGFEMGGTSECGATGGTAPTISSAQAYSGTYSALVDVAAGTGTSYIRVGGFTASGSPTNWSLDQTYIEFRIRIDTLPGTNEEIAEVMNTSDTLKAAIRVTSTGKLQLYNSGGTTQIGSDGTTTLNTATWYRIGIYTSNGTSTKAELRINGSPEITSTTADLGATNTGFIRLGKVTNRNSGALKAYYDDVSCDSTEWPGDTKLEYRVPNAVGTYDEYTASAGTKVDCVTDIPYDTGDYIYNALATGDQTFTFPDLSANCTEEIVCQQVMSRCAESSSSTSATGLCYVAGGTQYSTSTSDPGSSAVTRGWPKTWNPYYQRYWKKSEANAVEAGVINRAAKQVNTYTLGIYTEYRVGATSARPTINQLIGFERGDGEDIYALSGTYSIQGTTKITGNYSLKCNPSTSATSVALIYQSDWSDRVVFAHPEMFVGFMMRITTLPGGTGNSEEIAGFETSATSQIGKLRITSEGKLAMYDSSNTIIGSAGSTTLSTGTDYHISLGVHIGSSGAFSVKIDGGSDELSGTGSFGTTNIGIVCIGKRTNRTSQGYEIYFDDIVCSPTTHPKSTWRVKRLGPDGDGTYTTNWTASTGSLYACIDEVPNSATDYIYSTTSSADYTATLGSCSGAGIDGPARAIKMVVTRKANASSATSRQVIYRNSHFMRSNTQTDSTTAGTWGFVYDGDFGADGGLEWTTTVLDALEVGIRCASTSQINVESFDCQVLYDAPSGPQSATAEIATATAVGLAPTGTNPYAATAAQAAAVAAGLAPSAANTYAATALQATAIATALSASEAHKLVATAQIATAVAAGLSPTGANPYAATALQATAVATALTATGVNPWQKTALQATAVAAGLAPTAANPYSATAQQAIATAAALAATSANPYSATALQATATAAALTASASQASGPQYATTQIASAVASGLAPTAANPYAATALLATATATALAATGVNPWQKTALQATATAVGLAPSAANPYAATAQIATATAVGLPASGGQTQAATAQIATATAVGLAPSAANKYAATAQQATATATALAATGVNPWNKTAAIATATATGLAPSATNTYAATAQQATATATALVASSSMSGAAAGARRSADLDFLETMYFNPDNSMNWKDRAILSGVYAEILLQDTPAQLKPIPEEIGMKWGL